MLAHALMLLLAATPDDEPAAAPPDDAYATYTKRHHFEGELGFLGGVRNETRGGFTFQTGTSDAESLTAPFALAPYDRTIVYGIAVEARYVTRHVRFTYGMQKPFASFRMIDTLSGDVGTRSLDLWDYRVGLGTEYAWKYVAPFVDLIGDIQSIKASLTVGPKTADYQAVSFGFVVRAGVRIHMGDGLYLAPSGEIGVGGPVQWAVGLHAGWVVGFG